MNLVTAPNGVEWRIRRRWVTPRIRLGRPRRSVDNTSVVNGILSPPYWDLDSFVVGGVVIAVLAFIVVPLFLFGIELVLAGFVIAASVISKLLLGRPWLIEARPVNDASQGRLEWEVAGWRRSRALVRSIADDVAAGRDPQPRAPGTAVPS